MLELCEASGCLPLVANGAIYCAGEKAETL